MKKTLLTILCVLTAFCAMAQSEKTYTEPLVVTINGLSTPPQDASVAVIDNGDGTINFELKNFLLGAGEECMPVGNITIENLPVTKGEDGLDYISYNGNIFIQPGDMVGLSEEDWLGPVISSLSRDENGNPIGIPVVLQGKMNDEKLFVTIDIDMQSEIVYVQLGTDDFFFEGKIYTEPLVVTINGLSTPPQSASVVVENNESGTINFELKNFFLGAGEESLPVGNITIENLPVTKGEDGLDYISYSGNIFIQPGDMVGLSEEDWLGPVISSLNRDENGNPIGIPVVLQGKMNDEKLFVTIDIDMQSEIIYVQLGTDDFFGVVIGDLNGDTKVDIADAVTVLNIMAAGEYSKAADINNDEKIDIADFVSILNIMAEM